MRPALARDTPIDILTGGWSHGTFCRWTRHGALVATRDGHKVIVPEDSVRPLLVHVSRYLPLWDRDRGSWRIVDTSGSVRTVASFASVGTAAFLAEHLNAEPGDRGEYEWAAVSPSESERIEAIWQALDDDESEALSARDLNLASLAALGESVTGQISDAWSTGS